MAKKDHCGSRRTRRQVSSRIPDLGYYCIVTDTESTEANYMKGLHDSLPAEYKDRIVIKVVKTKTAKLIKTCQEQISMNPQYAEGWIVFDRDQVVGFDEIIKNAENAGINVGWSNPCFEIWLGAYLDKINHSYNSVSCCNEFALIFRKKLGIDYKKSNENLYSLLVRHGNEKLAIERAEDMLKKFIQDGIKKPSEMCPCTTVHHLVREIRSKIEFQNE